MRAAGTAKVVPATLSAGDLMMRELPEAVADLAPVGPDGGYREDVAGYQWYAGI